MAFFSGEYHHQVDEKNRIRIPAKLRELLGDNPFITWGADGCLLVFKKEEADKILDSSFGSVTFADVDRHQALRMMSAKGLYAEEDKQGRILLPKHLTDYAKIKKDVVTIGSYRYVEIWAGEEWKKYSELSAEQFKESLRKISLGKQNDSQ